MAPFFFYYFLFKKIKKTKATNWQSCLKQKPREATLFHLLHLALAWGRTMDFDVLFLISVWQDAIVSYLHIASDPLIPEIKYPASSISKYTF